MKLDRKTVVFVLELIHKWSGATLEVLDPKVGKKN